MGRHQVAIILAILTGASGLVLVEWTQAPRPELGPLLAPFHHGPCLDFTARLPRGRLVEDAHWGKGGRFRCTASWTPEGVRR